MQVLLLAAGQSKRMWPVGDKNFLKFCGRELILHQINNLQKAGFNEFILVGGKHNLKQLQEITATLEMPIIIVEQKKLDDGMRGAVLAGEKYLNKPTLIMSSNDVIAPSAFQKISDSITKNCKIENFILAQKVTSYFPGGYLNVDKNNFVKNIIEKPGAGKEPSDLVNIVVHFFRNPQKLIDLLKKSQNQNDDAYEQALGKLAKNKQCILAVPYENFWQPIKYPWHILKVMDYFLQKNLGNISSQANISNRAIIKGPVVIEKGAKIFEGAIINGPAYIGKNTIVANNALVRNSIVGENCVIGYSTEIARSFLSDNIWTHTNYIGDSVILDNTSFGAGTVTGNLRLDEGEIFSIIKKEKINTGLNKLGNIVGPNTRVGINASLMPGVKIGGNTFIGGGIIVDQDIPDDSFVTSKSNFKIVPNKSKNLDPEKRELMKKNFDK